MNFRFILVLIGFFALELKAQVADYYLLKKIYKDSSFAATQVFKGVSNSVSYVSILQPTALYLYGHNNDLPQLKREALKNCASVMLASGISGALKIAIKRKRPYNKYPDFFKAKQHTGPHSFPSGHAAMAFANATAVSLATREPGVIIPSFLWAGAVAYSRMYLGVHFPSDVLGGMIIGIGAGVIVWQIDQLLLKN